MVCQGWWGNYVGQWGIYTEYLDRFAENVHHTGTEQINLSATLHDIPGITHSLHNAETQTLIESHGAGVALEYI